MGKLKKTYLLGGIPFALGEELLNDMHIYLNDIGLIFMNQKEDSYEIEAEIEENNRSEIVMWMRGWLSGHNNAAKNSSSYVNNTSNEEELENEHAF